MTPTDVRSARTFKSVVCSQTRLILFMWLTKRTNLSGSRFSHQCSQLPRDDITRDIIQQLPLASTANGNRVVQALPREGISHLLGTCQSLFSLRLICTKIVDRVRSSGSGGLYVVRLRYRILELFSSALECDDRPPLGEFGFELGDDEVSGKESKAKSDNDAKILKTKM